MINFRGGLIPREHRNAIVYMILPVVISILLVFYGDYLISFPWKSWGLLGVFLVMLISSATIFMPIPGLAVATLVGYYTNPLLVAIAGGVGSALGELTGYLMGYGSSKILQEHEIYWKIAQKVQGKKGFIFIVITALVPNPLFDAAGLAAGAVKYPWWKFLIACALGKILKVLLFASAGAVISFF